MRTLLAFAVYLPVAMVAQSTTLAHLPNTNVYAAQSDAAGNVYVAGFQGSFSQASPFVAKFSPTGQTLYSTTLTVSSFGLASAIAVDSSGAAYIFGYTNSADFPVTPGAFETTMQSGDQDFAAKVDSNGKVIYATFIGSNTTTSPGMNSLVVDSAGDAILSSASSVMKLDPTGAKLLGSMQGIGGSVALDGEGNVYVAGAGSQLSTTAGVFQSSITTTACNDLGVSCSYQYVAKLNASLTQIIYATFISGSYGASPVAISVDAQGNAFVAGTTYGADYPTTPNAFESAYLLNPAPVAPYEPCLFNCHPFPPSSGYLTKLNATGTSLLYSTYFSGTQPDSISYAAFTPNAIYVSGTAGGTADLPGFSGYPNDLPGGSGLYPAQCLPPSPQTYATRLSADATEVSASSVVSIQGTTGTVVGYDAAAGALLVWAGTDLVTFDPTSPPALTPIACIVDAADLQPVTSVAPGEVLAIFGEQLSATTINRTYDPTTAPLGGVSIAVNGIASPLLYVSPQQINVQVPFEIAGSPNADITYTPTATTSPGDSRTLEVAGSQPVAFLDLSTAPASCGLGPMPLTFNADGSRNTCANPAPAGSVVTVLLDGLGVTSPAQVTGAITASPASPGGLTLNEPITAINGAAAFEASSAVPPPTALATGVPTVVSASALPGTISGIWAVGIQMPAGQTGAMLLNLTVGGVAVRDAGMPVWVTQSPLPARSPARKPN